MVGVKHLFIEDKVGTQLPYFIESAKAKSQDETLLKLEDINSKEEAQLLTRKAVWLALPDFEKHAAANATIALVGYNMFEDDTLLGIIVEVIEQKHQVLCTVNVNGKEALIPLHPESLKKIDRSKKQVHVALPDGLLEIYLG